MLKLLKNIESYNEGHLFKSLKNSSEVIIYFGIDFYIRKIKKNLDVKDYLIPSVSKTLARAVFDEFQC